MLRITSLISLIPHLFDSSIAHHVVGIRGSNQHVDVDSTSSIGGQVDARFEAVIQDTGNRFFCGNVEQPRNLSDMSLRDSNVETSKIHERLTINCVPSAGSDCTWSQEAFDSLPHPFYAGLARRRRNGNDLVHVSH